MFSIHMLSSFQTVIFWAVKCINNSENAQHGFLEPKPYIFAESWLYHTCLNPHAQPCWAKMSTWHWHPTLLHPGTLFLMNVLVWSFNIMLIMSNTTMVLAAALYPPPPYVYNNYKRRVLRMHPPFTGTYKIWNYPITTLLAFAVVAVSCFDV